MKESSRQILEEFRLGVKHSIILKDLVNHCSDMDGRKVFSIGVRPIAKPHEVIIPVVLEGDRPESFEETGIKDKWTAAIAEQYRTVPGFFDLNLDINIIFLDEIIREWGSYDNYYR